MRDTYAMSRATAILIATCALLLAACSSSGETQPATTVPSAGEIDFADINTLEDTERREFAARLERELEAGKERRSQQVAANRVALGRLSEFPRSVALRETHQGNDTSDSSGTTEELEYSLFMGQTLSSYEQQELVDADSWSSYRTYRLPAETDAADVQRFYAEQLRAWTHVVGHRDLHGRGHELFDDSYTSGGRCIWVQVGHGSIEPARSLEVATSAGDCP